MRFASSSSLISRLNHNMVVSKNRGTPKSSILIGFSIINHPFWGTTIFGNSHIPVVPHKAVAEVSRIGDYRRDWLL